ncbi:MAG: hypothetical protein CVU56_23380 [Deltaproteobacteria bacterium HGW-Deltaproteobacteria-14]|nr:MAG: hypothetical protein CVU56_23380 [Deltaproteobacteria bacterium HGW-Deltaproteobacteria-14]
MTHAPPPLRAHSLACLAACALLACARPAAAPAEGPPVDRLELRVASFNAWLLPFASRDLGDRLDRMPAAIDALAPDVLCLQEAWFPFQRDDLEAGLEHRLPYASYGGGGVALLSRFPIVEERFHAFADDEALSITERMGGKGVFEVVLRTPAGPLRVLDTHLALDRGAGGGHARQLDQLRGHLGARPELPTVLCADLNMRATEAGALVPGYAALLAAGYTDTIAPVKQPDGAFAQRPTTRVGWPRAERRGRGWSPDFVLFRGAAAGGPALTLLGARVTLDTAETALSDHNLLLADLALGTPAP